MVDRGGLNYKITVTGSFGELTKFKKEARGARGEFRKLKQELARPARGGRRSLQLLQGQARTTLQLAQARREEARAARLQVRSAALEARARQQTNARGSESRKIVADHVRALRAERVETQRLTRALLALARARKKAGVAAGASPATPAAAPATRVPAGSNRTLKQRIADFLGLSKATKSAGNEANRASFTFRRLFGILAAFTIARQIAAGFAAAVRNIVSFNSTIETSTLGIATLLTAVGEVRDSTGRVVTGVEGLAVASGVAREQIQLLRKDSLLTAATFEELLETFQVALAPGLSAGLDVDQIRRFTLQISQAATAIGLSGNQLAEEIRSILSGTIQARTTRIAVALGITNEDIRRAREAGTLAEFLQERFAAFEIAGKEALNTFGAIFTNLRAGVQQALGEGGILFFETLKSLLKDINDLVVQQDPLTGKLEINPGVVAAIKEIGDALAFAVLQVREIGSGLGFGDLINVAQVIGAVIRTISATISGFVEGFSQGLSGLVEVIEEVVSAITGLEGSEIFNIENLRQAARFIGQLVGFIGPIVIGFSAVRGIISTIASLLRPITAAFSIISAIVTGISAKFLLIGGLVAAVVVGVVLLADRVKKFIGDLTGVELKWRTIARIVSTVVVNAFKFLIATVKFGFIGITTGAQQAMITVKTVVINSARAIVTGLLKLASLVSDTAKDKLREVQRETRRFNAEQGRAFDELAKRQSDAAKELGEASASIVNSTVEDIKDALEDDSNLPEETFTEFIKNSVVEGLSGIGDAFQGILPEAEFDLDLDTQAVDASNLLSVLSGIPGTVSTSREGLEANKELMEQIKQETLQANEALEVQARTVGLVGAALRAQTALVRDEQQQRQRTAVLDREAIAGRERLRQAILRQEAAQRRISNLSQGDQDIVAQAVQLSNQLTRSNSDLSRAKQRLAVEQSFLNTAEGEQVRLAQEKVRLAEAEVDQQQQSVNKTTDQINQLNDLIQTRAAGTAAAFGTDDADKRAADLNKLVVQRIQTQNEELAAQEALKQIDQDRLNLLVQTNEALTRRITFIAREQQEQAQAEIARLRVQSESRQRLEAAGSDPVAQRLAASLNDLALRRLELATEEQERNRQIAALRQTQADLETRRQTISEAAIRGEVGLVEATTQVKNLNEAINEIIESRGSLESIDQIQEQDAAAELARLKRLADIARVEGTGTFEEIGLGLITGIEEANAQLPTLMQTMSNTITTAVQGIANIAGQAFVGIFTNKDKDINDQLADLLEQIAAQIISTLVQIAIVKNILLPFLGEPTATNVAQVGANYYATPKGNYKGGPIGLATGGNVPEASQSYARPAGLHPTDTVPIWAAPGEYMVRESSARKYGRDVMNAINQGLIDPYTLRALAGSQALRRVARAPKKGQMGFADGGEIPQGTGAVPAGAGQAPTPQQALLLADEETMEQLLTAGGDALVRHAESQRSALRAALGITG